MPQKIMDGWCLEIALLYESRQSVRNRLQGREDGTGPGQGWSWEQYHPSSATLEEALQKINPGTPIKIGITWQRAAFNTLSPAEAKSRTEEVRKFVEQDKIPQLMDSLKAAGCREVEVNLL